MTIRKSGKWLEIVYLVVPTLNDSVPEVQKMAAWVKKELGPNVPVHLTRFHPMYLLKNLPPTPVPVLERLRDAAVSAGLNYVYIGNVPGHDGENTYCHSCKKQVITRNGFAIQAMKIREGRCSFCGTAIPGVWA